MKVSFVVAALLVSPAHADLYRWVDRETGSVKFSNTPPPWYGDPAKAPPDKPDARIFSR